VKHPNAPEIDADLEIEDPWGRSMSLRVRNGHCTIEIPRAALGLRTLKSLPPPGERAAWMRRIERIVPIATPRCRVTCGGRTVARLTPERARGNWLGRMLGVAPFEVRLTAIVAAVLLPRRRV
jgi:hypothetical protein